MDDFVAAAARAMDGALGLEFVEPLRAWDGYTSVARLRVLGGAPATVVAKRAGNFAPYDPDDADGPAWYLFNEWAGLAHLTALAIDPPVSPRFLGGDRASGVIVYEDLGAGDSLAEVLLGTDPYAAREGLFDWARALGRVHAATIGHAAEWDALRASLGPPREPSSFAADAFATACASIGHPLDARVQREVERAIEVVNDPGPFHAYTPGDVCPDNNRLASGRALLFDFTWGGYGHALLDAAYMCVPMPTCWCVNALPDRLPQQLVVAYQEALGIDDDRFDRDMLAACVVWALTNVATSLPRALLTTQSWGISTHAQRLALRLPMFVRMSRAAGEFVAFAEHLERIATALQLDRFPMPLYPAFRSGMQAASVDVRRAT